MKTLMYCTMLVIFNTSVSFAQQKMFHVYTDSAQLVSDANALVKTFTEELMKIKPGINLAPTAILNTQPYLIFYNNKKNTVNLPIWYQVMAPQKEFFYKLAGGQEEGMKVFGLLFNGFYLPHELGHAVQYAAGKETKNEYDNEYFANTIAVLYWRKAGKLRELDESYQYAKKFLKQLANPVPAGEDEKAFLTTHYNEIARDPFKYGYFEFSQFVKIYEDKTLPDFDTFLKDFFR